MAVASFHSARPLQPELYSPTKKNPWGSLRGIRSPPGLSSGTGSPPWARLGSWGLYWAWRGVRGPQRVPQQPLPYPWQERQAAGTGPDEFPWTRLTWQDQLKLFLRTQQDLKYASGDMERHSWPEQGNWMHRTWERHSWPWLRNWILWNRERHYWSWLRNWILSSWRAAAGGLDVGTAGGLEGAAAGGLSEQQPANLNLEWSTNLNERPVGWTDERLADLTDEWPVGLG